MGIHRARIVRVGSFAVMLLAWGAVDALAQATAAELPRSYAYGYAAALDNADLGRALTPGAGGDRVDHSGASVGGDFTLLAKNHLGHRFAAAGLNAGFHLLGVGGKFVPFVTTGPMVWFGYGLGFGWHVEAGANYWFTKHAGLRVEVRKDVPGWTDLPPFAGVRIGVTLH